MAELVGGDIVFPSPPEWEKRVDQPYTADTTKSLSQPQIAVQEESLSQAEREKAAADEKAKLEGEKAGIEAAGAQAKEDQARATNAEKARVDEAETAKIAKRADELRAANEAIRATPAPALMADRKGWDKAKLAIGMALAGLGDAINAKASAVLGRPAGPSAVTDIITMDLERQRENLKKLTDSQIMAKEGVKDALAARELALAKVDMKGAALFNLASQHVETLLKAKGVPAAQIAGNEAKLALDRAEVESKKRAVAGLADEHTRTGQKVEETTRAKPDATNEVSSRGQLAVVKNPDGSTAGYAPAGAAHDVNKETVLRAAAGRALKHYDDVVAKVGGRAVIPGTDDYNLLKGAHADAIAAITSVKNMPGTDKSSLVEAERLGPSGNGPWKVDRRLIRNLARANKDQGLHAIQMTANSAVQTRKSGETFVPTPAAPAPPAAATAAPAAAPVAPAQAPVPSTQPMVPPKPDPPPPVMMTAAEKREALKWAKGPGRGTPKAEEILKALGVK